MKRIPDKIIDMILCDLPYGVTSCKWDSIIPLKELWEQYNRIIKDKGAIVLTSCQPFTTELISSNRRMFRYCWYWVKNQCTGFQFAKYQPMRCIEDVCVFYKQMPTYNPQGLIKLEQPQTHMKKRTEGERVYNKATLEGKEFTTMFTNYPKHILNIKCQREGLHPTQKPVELFEYLIKTYTNEGDIVLDNCMGSGTTAIACLNTNRYFIGFELNGKYFDVAIKRINEHS